MSSEQEEQRGLERRVFTLEQRMNEVYTVAKVTEAKLDGLISTVDSRHKAFEKGQELILIQLKPLDPTLSERHKLLEGRVKVLEDIKNIAAGALLMVKLLSIAGIITCMVAIFKMVTH